MATANKVEDDHFIKGQEQVNKVMCYFPNPYLRAIMSYVMLYWEVIGSSIHNLATANDRLWWFTSQLDKNGSIHHYASFLIRFTGISKEVDLVLSQ